MVLKEIQALLDPTAIRERKGKRLEDLNNVLFISIKCLCWLHITGRERTSWGNWIDRIKRTAWTKGLEKKNYCNTICEVKI